jgi:hypothetical protein
MSFTPLLGRLLDQTPEAVAALFLDESGETVEMVASDLPEEDIRLVGAYLGIHLRQLGRILRDARMGEPRWVHLEKDALHLHVLTLPDGYYLMLIQRRPAVVASARRCLLQAAEELRREAFG